MTARRAHRAPGPHARARPRRYKKRMPGGRLIQLTHAPLSVIASASSFARVLNLLPLVISNCCSVTMSKLLIFLAAAAAVAAAAVVLASPMRRKVTELEMPIPLDKFNYTIDDSIICNPETPCGWTVYIPQYNKDPQKFIHNTYCRCSDHTVCIYYSDDITIGTFIHRCQKPHNLTTPAWFPMGYMYFLNKTVLQTENTAQDSATTEPAIPEAN